MKKVLAFILLVSLIIPFVASAESDDIVGYHKGFFIKSRDGNFKLTITSKTRVKWQLLRTTKESTKQTFRIRGADLQFKADIYKKYYTFLKLYHSTKSQYYSGVNILYGGIGARFSPYFNLEAGIVDLPLQFPSGDSLLSEGSLVVTQADGQVELTPLRSSFGSPTGLGVWADGGIDKFFYQAAVINGNDDPYILNVNKWVSAGFLVGYHILGDANTKDDYACSVTPQLTVTSGFNYQGKRYQMDATNTNVTARINYLLTGSMGAGFRYSGFSATGNAFLRKTNVPWSNLVWTRSNLTDFGYYLTLGYYIFPKKLQAVLQGGQIFRQGPDNNSNQLGGGLNYYIVGQNIMLTADYIWTEDYDDVAGRKNNQEHMFGIMMTAKF
ncbi:MAG: hypothetical protein ABIE74_02930 [Pseudomonadota bacterium]